MKTIAKIIKGPYTLLHRVWDDARAVTASLHMYHCDNSDEHDVTLYLPSYWKISTKEYPHEEYEKIVDHYIKQFEANHGR